MQRSENGSCVFHPATVHIIYVIHDSATNYVCWFVLCLQVECIIQETLNDDGSQHACGPQLAGDVSDYLTIQSMKCLVDQSLNRK